MDGRCDVRSRQANASVVSEEGNVNVGAGQITLVT